MDERARRAAIALYDRFTHEGLDRRTFMTELTRIAGGAAAATALLGSVAARAQAAPSIAEADPRIEAGPVNLETSHGRIYEFYRASPVRVGGQAPPVVIVIHENRGLNAHIRDVARRFAVAGYRAYAPDMLSLNGGTPADEDRARALIGQIDLAAATSDLAALVRDISGEGGKAGIVGFCWGGAMVHRVALAAGQALSAGVSFYGPAPEPAEAAGLQSPLLVILAGRDERVNRTALPYVAAVQAARKPICTITYRDVDHAFHNDTSAARYNRAAAEDAWSETLRFFNQHLR